VDPLIKKEFVAAENIGVNFPALFQEYGLEWRVDRIADPSPAFERATGSMLAPLK
jgi:hypothetical protein